MRVRVCVRMRMRVCEHVHVRVRVRVYADEIGMELTGRITHCDPPPLDWQ